MREQEIVLNQNKIVEFSKQIIISRIKDARSVKYFYYLTCSI